MSAEATTGLPETGPRRPKTRLALREGRRFLELFAACGFAIAQPLLSVFGRSPDEFIFRNATSKQIVLFAIAVCVIPPIGLWILESMVGLVSRRAMGRLHTVFVAALAALFAVQLLKRVVSTAGVLVVIGGVLAGVGFGLLYTRVRATRTWLTYASPAPVLFALVFLFSSSVAPLVSSSTDVAVVSASNNQGRPSVVLVVFDEWPTGSIVGNDGQIDPRLYPNLARLGARSTWYRNSTSVTSATWYAVPTILTGQYPKDGEIPEASSHPESIFSLLAGTHRLSVSEIVTRVCPRALCASTATPGSGGAGGARGVLNLMGEAASVYGTMVGPTNDRADPTTGFKEDEVEQAVSEAKAATGDDDHANLDLGVATTNRPERFNHLLASLRAGEGPTLHVLHVLLPHVPHRHLPDGLEYPAPDNEFGKVDDDWTHQTWPPALANERLLLQVGYVDRVVGELLDRLEATNLLDRSLVVLTADHGIAFTPGQPVRGLSETPVPQSLYPQLLWAPLIVKAPGQTTGTVSDANVMSIDVVPTIAKILDVSIPWKVDGVPAGERKDPEKVFQKATVNPFGVGLAPAVRFDGRPGLAQMLRRNVDAITQPGSDALQPYRVGTEGVLVGRALDELQGDRASLATAVIQQRDALEHVDKASGTVPALVWGSLDRAATVAIAVNDRIGGVSPTFSDAGTPLQFAAMVPSRYLRNGSNAVQLFEVSGTDANPVLLPIRIR